MLRFLHGHGLTKENWKGGGHWILSSSTLPSGNKGSYNRGWKAVIHGPNPVSYLLSYGSEAMNNFIF